jgi:hypothetical protein
MAALAGPFVVAAALVALAGAQKLLDPRNTVGALRALGWNVPALAVRAGAAIELGVGAGALATGRAPFALALVASYAAFAGFVEVARRRGTMVGSCGCFGARDTPPSLVHVVVDVGLALVAVGWLAADHAAPLRGLGDAPGGGLPFVLLALVTTGLTYAALTELPRTLAEVRRVTTRRAAAHEAAL